MPFNAPVFFALFVPIVVAGYWLVAMRAGPRWAVASLVFASLLFYSWWKAQFIFLLLGSMAFNYCVGRILDRRKSGAVLAFGVGVNLIVLGAFKYLDFIAQSITALGLELGPFGIVLPIGISFFTFEQITYLADIKAGRSRAGTALSYALFISFFPHLIAGPILKFARLDAQLERGPDLKSATNHVAIGLSIFVLGLAKKVLFADSFAAFATPVFDQAAAGQQVGIAAAWSGALAYALQIYFDFSGYSDMAIGLARMVGLHLPINFNSPYRSASIAEFWRRWHITLSHFLRDYLYIPLGGNRRGTLRQAVNLLIVMLLGGLWHGAAWNFVLWGGLHGAALASHRFWLRWAKPHDIEMPRLLAQVLTLLFVIAAWVPFRAASAPASGRILSAMLGIGDMGAPIEMMTWVAIAAGFAACMALPNVAQWFQSELDEREVSIAGIEPAHLPLLSRHVQWQPNAITATVVGLTLFVTVSSLQRSSEFIYFQF